MVFYALASSRMRIAERLCTVVQSHVHSAAYQPLLHVRLDLVQLVQQIDALTLAATIELTYANGTSDSWKTTKHLFVSVLTHTLSQRDTTLKEYMEVLFTITKAILRDLQTQIQVYQSDSMGGHVDIASGLLSEAQYMIEAVGSSADWPGTFPVVPNPFQTVQSPSIETVLQELLRLIEAAGAELAAPGITQTALWREIFGDTRRPALR